jgi:rhamnose transport system ATP-binding protein
MEKQPYLEIANISKRFGATQALDNVSLKLYSGEVHALLGENGAGKSTLIKIMTGIHQADSGHIFIGGKNIKLRNSADAQRKGIVAIYQEPLVFPDLTVAENIFIGHRQEGLIVNWQKMINDAEYILGELGVALDPRSQARGLTLAAQQTVEIAKALSLNAQVLIMDEPTASLSAHEVEQLFKITRILRDRGVCILFISHRMDEIFEIADRVTVFRDGRHVSTAPISDVSRDSLIQDMVGRKLEAFFASKKHERGDLLLSVRELSKRDRFSGISFDLHHGEILGFAGLVGAGRTDVALALFGVEPADNGLIEIDGRTEVIKSPHQAMKLGIAYVTEDRRQLGLTLPMSITANITLPKLRDYLMAFGIINRNKESQTAEDYRKRLAIRTSSIWQEVGKLSGGNQQKVVLSKWLNTDPRILILDEPTRGIDVGAKAEVHQIIHELAEQGMAIILISSDLPEVLAMSDRILVMREGKQMGIFGREEATQELIIGTAMGQVT